MNPATPGNGTPAPRFVSTVPSPIIQTGFQRYERPVFDYATKYPPCQAHCPAGHDIAWALFLAARDRYDLAYQTFLEESPFPAVTGRVCYHPCETACHRGSYDQPLAVQSLERTFPEFAREVPEPFTGRRYGETVGVLGAGPAGLTCAYHLVNLGYEVVVYDAHPLPGGVLAWGIPPYRLPRPVLQQELQRMERGGLQFRLNTRIGRDLSFAEVQSRHDALFLGLGLSRPRPLPLPVPDHPRILAGIDFLRQVSQRYLEGTAEGLSGRVVVIGGGDVAIDAARSARRWGAAEVWLCCLEKRPEMLAHPEEVDAALCEGLQLQEQVAVQQIEVKPPGLQDPPLLLHFAPVAELHRAEDGSVSYTLQTSVPPWNLAADYLIYALGQQADLSSLPEPLRARSCIEVDRFGQTALPGVFAGGDVVGVYNVVQAIGSAKRAAIGIDLFLRGWDPHGLEEQIRIGPEGALSMAAYRTWRAGLPLPRREQPVGLEEINLAYFPASPRQAPPSSPPQERVQSFAEVNTSFTLEAARAEAQRCFNCGICNMCGNCFIYCPDSSVVQLVDWGFTIDLDHCKGCGVCVEECPRDAMSMIPEREVRDHEAAVA